MRPSAGLGWFGFLLRPTTVGRLWLPGPSGHQLRWLARQVCSVVFGGVRGTCVPSHVWHPGLLLRHSGLLCCGVHCPELKVTPKWCQWRVEPWSPKGSRMRRRRQRRADRGNARRRRLKSRIRKICGWYVVSGPKGIVVNARLACGPDWESNKVWLAGSRWLRSSWRKLWWDDWAACRCHP